MELRKKCGKEVRVSGKEERRSMEEHNTVTTAKYFIQSMD
jgi:hypothetical protein